jgi:hypothetical protein
MTSLEAALLELAGALEDCRLPYALIGGLAVSLSGEPRATLDVDVSVWAAPDQLVAAIDCLCARFRAYRMIPVASVEDLLFMKLLSTREKDTSDAAALFRRFGSSLDRGYLVPKLKEAADALDRPDILAWFGEVE